MNVTKKISGGFTLLEMIIALAILGILLAGIMGPLSTKYAQSQRQETSDKLQDIKEALLGFALTNGRFPCPDTDNDGLENVNAGTVGSQTCVGSASAAFVSGNVPHTTLGVDELDPWRMNFQYIVTGSFADDIPGAARDGAVAACGTATLGVSFELCSGGNLDIHNSATSGDDVVTALPVIVFSTAKHGLATQADSDRSADENENTDADNLFVYRDLSTATGTEFDDLMIWISPNVLKYRMVQAGRLP